MAIRIRPCLRRLELLEQVDREGIRTLDLHLYGISNNPQIVDAAKEAIADSEELAEWARAALAAAQRAALRKRPKARITKAVAKKTAVRKPVAKKAKRTATKK